ARPSDHCASCCPETDEFNGGSPVAFAPERLPGGLRLLPERQYQAGAGLGVRPENARRCCAAIAETRRTGAGTSAGVQRTRPAGHKEAAGIQAEAIHDEASREDSFGLTPCG